MQGFMEEQKATAGLNSGNRHTATTADGQATPTHTNQTPRPPNRPLCPKPNSHPDQYQAALPHTNQPPRL